jgi:FKBP-type peptidyl-prolyl cis-trans isomerase FkpA
LVIPGCHSKKREKSFSYHPLGYYYQLISFESDSTLYEPRKVAWVTAIFKTQSDSIFWDSFNNLNDKFYLRIDSSEKNNFLKNYISKCSALDSACVLIRPHDFFRQQFKTDSIPFFSKKDSIVKINFKIKQVLSKEAFVKIRDNLQKKEMQQIEDFYGSGKDFEMAADPQGFYWIKKPEYLEHAVVRPGDLVTISYNAHYLNGRFLEKSGNNFEFIYGTPDQVLKGLNYVIGRLKLGENAKIILPSRLAFGENGSSNGTVPPYTPLVYEIELIDLKTGEMNP